MQNLKCLHNIGKLLNPKADGGWEEIRQAAILFDEKILRIGAEKEVLPAAKKSGAEMLNTRGSLVTPGLVDSHTHTAFAEERAGEYLLRNQGKSYQEIAASGGGIRSSVRSLRALAEDELVARMLPRLDRFLTCGVTTIEVKSGYGLSTEHELKQLRAIRHCGELHPLQLVPTLLAAHEIPDEYRQNKATYLDIVINETIPAAAEEKLARFCDVFCEEGVFSVSEARRVLETGKKYDLIPKIHADQLSGGGGAELAAEIGAASADHLDHISDQGIEFMVRAGVVFSVLPGAVLFLGLHRYPPLRHILERGGALALATDFNPGTCPSQNLALMMTLACSFGKLTPGEALWAATRGGACSLRLEGQVGSLDSQAAADLIIWDCQDEALIPYYFGMNLVWEVYKAGQKVVESGTLVAHESQ